MILGVAPGDYHVPRPLILSRQRVPSWDAIDDLVLIGETTIAEGWAGKIVFLPH